MNEVTSSKLRLELKQEETGKGTITISGVESLPDELEIALSDTDARYIGNDANTHWRTDRVWHRLWRQPDGTFSATAAIVDTLAHEPVGNVHAEVRWGGGMGKGILLVPPGLTSSVARKAASQPPPPAVSADLPRDATQSATLVESEPADSTTPQQDAPSPDPRRRSLRVPIIAGISSVLLVGALAAWLLLSGSDQTNGDTLVDKQPIEQQTNEAKSNPSDDRVDESGQKLTSSKPGAEPTLESNPEVEKPPSYKFEPERPVAPEPVGQEPKFEGEQAAMTPGPEPDPHATGQDYVSQLIDHTRDPRIWIAKVETRTQRGDCQAVHLLYDLAARADPKIAGRVARIYDPVGFSPAPPCITAADPVRAEEYYALAANSGNTYAMGRYGQILVERGASEPSHKLELRDGLKMLHQAAAAGDDAARSTLESLRFGTFENPTPAAR